MRNILEIVHTLEKTIGNNYETAISQASANLDYGLDMFELVELCRIHSEGDVFTKDVIEDLLEDINYHTIGKCVSEGRYEDAVKFYLS